MAFKERVIVDFNRKRVIVGVGSALVDILARESNEFLTRAGAVKGGMVYVDNAHIDRTLSMTSSTPAVVPGGSACNTAVGVGQLGGAARFVGTCGQGTMGTYFENALRTRRVDPRLTRSSTPTGRVLSIITPDAERSMLTFLGAASETRPEDLREDYFADAAIVHIEGYLLFNPHLIVAALKAARSAGARVSLDLASHNVVAQSRDFLLSIVRDYVDILIANEDEARAFTGQTDPEKALSALGREAQMAALKLGPRGSRIVADGRVVSVPAQGDGRAVDTTGAGDLWAAGFLFGLVSGYSLEKSGAIGSACGYEVCQVMGASIPEEGWQRIRRLLGPPHPPSDAAAVQTTGEAIPPLQAVVNGRAKIKASAEQGGPRGSSGEKDA
jgi:sugar/nucleoside kinase (ribokinase family)